MADITIAGNIYDLVLDTSSDWTWVPTETCRTGACDDFVDDAASYTGITAGVTATSKTLNYYLDNTITGFIHSAAVSANTDL